MNSLNSVIHSEDVNQGFFLFFYLVYDVGHLFTMGYVGQPNIKVILDFKKII